MPEEFDQERRRFLGGKLLGFSHDASEFPLLRPPQNRAATHLERYSKNAMACEFELLLNLHQYQNAAEVGLQAFAMLDSIESQMSIYRDDSELSRLNRSAADKTVAIDQRLFDVIQLAEEIYSLTDGAFDVTAAPLSRLWGFSRRAGRVPSEQEIEETLPSVGMHHIKLDPSTSTVQFTEPKISIDLGGIGKGFAIDLASQLLISHGIHDFVFQGGQSSVAAFGQSIESEPSSTQGWKVGLSHPTTPDCRLAEFDLVNQVLGTSGTQRQGFFYKGKRYGHIIDPRSGVPTDHCLSSTVICRQAAAADALATAFFVMTLDEIQSYCSNRQDVVAVLVYPDQKTGVRLETFNGDQVQWQTLI